MCCFQSPEKSPETQTATGETLPCAPRERNGRFLPRLPRACAEPQLLSSDTQIVLRIGCALPQSGVGGEAERGYWGDSAQRAARLLKPAVSCEHSTCPARLRAGWRHVVTRRGPALGTWTPAAPWTEHSGRYFRRLALWECFLPHPQRGTALPKMVYHVHRLHGPGLRPSFIPSGPLSLPPWPPTRHPHSSRDNSDPCSCPRMALLG